MFVTSKYYDIIFTNLFQSENPYGEYYREVNEHFGGLLIKPVFQQDSPFYSIYGRYMI